ncbi:MAG: MopE-related protein, partial [Myxococcota bacterium]|nr:MopE-related protein [Myxococcota bacterium]
TAEEVWYNGIDENCDGNDDDQDGDSFPKGADCNDQDAAANPNSLQDAVEIGYNCIDENCDGSDADLDGDGWLNVRPYYLDCDQDGVPNADDPECLSALDCDDDGVENVDDPDCENIPNDDSGLGCDWENTDVFFSHDLSRVGDCWDRPAEACLVTKYDCDGDNVPNELDTADCPSNPDVFLDCDGDGVQNDADSDCSDLSDCDGDGVFNPEDEDCLPTADPYGDCDDDGEPNATDPDCLDSIDLYTDCDGDGVPNSEDADCAEALDCDADGLQNWVDADCGLLTDSDSDCDGIPDGYEALNSLVQLGSGDVNPGVLTDEHYDGIDAACDGDEFEFDADADGEEHYQRLQRDGSVGVDCNDTDFDIKTTAEETCLTVGVDDDCDGSANDEGAFDCSTWYADVDSDGFGSDSLAPACTCEPFVPFNATRAGDCDDNHAAAYPDDPDTPEADAGVEICDGLDNDCNGTVDGADASDALTWYADSDSDGFGDPLDTQLACSAPVVSGVTYVDNDLDCSPTDPDAHPNALEFCDGHDDDCDGEIDEADAENTTLWYRDLDSDGFGDVTQVADACDAPTGFVAVADDCQDTDGTVFPQATELCDGLDNDCDGQIPDVELDHDADQYVECSVDGGGWDGVSIQGGDDCLDDPGELDASQVHPNATELCDGRDNDCDGLVSPEENDDDGDGYVECVVDSGGWDGTLVITDGGDCDDLLDSVFPGVPEVCDGLDNDCSGVVDDFASDAITFYQDADGDGFGTSTATTAACAQPSGYVSSSGDEDCDDSDPGISPAAAEVCDAGDVDEDCDGQTDDNDPEGALGPTDWYFDGDLDGFGDPNVSPNSACDPSGTFTADNADDCDDGNDDINPAENELCSTPGVDDDCDGTPDEGSAIDADSWYADLDGDSYGDDDSEVTACADPGGVVPDGGDCDDSDPAISPGAAETCDAANVDEDCDGQADDSDPEGASGGTGWFPDSDGDGQGDESQTNSLIFCDLGPGRSATNDDCDDSDATVFLSAVELCDGQDNDCDGSLLADEVDGDGDLEAICVLDAGGWDGAGSVSSGGDCDDTNASVNTSASEVCNDIDDDCQGGVDDGVTITFYEDADADTFGNPDSSTEDCSVPTGYVADDTDCDDTDSAINSAASEVANELDDDCDDLVDETFRLAGDLVITEIHADPAGPEPDLEWFEIYNPTSVDMFVDGLRFSTSCDSGAEFVVGVDGLVVGASGYAVLCHSDDVLGPFCDYVYGSDVNGTSQQGATSEASFCLSTDLNASLSLDLDGDSIDVVSWTPGQSGWPTIVEGASLTLNPANLTATENDDGTLWCYPAEFTDQYDFTNGNSGTPGAAASTCDASYPNGL